MPNLPVAPVPPPNNYPTRQVLREAERELEDAEGRPHEKARLWIQIARVHAKLGDHDAGTSALLKARKVINTYEASKKYLFHWWELGNGYARLGDAHVVFALAAEVPDRVPQHSVGQPEAEGTTVRQGIFRAAARAAIEAGQLAAALRIAEAITDPAIREDLKGRIQRQAVLNRAKAGDLAGAVKAIGELPSAVVKAQALVGVVAPHLFPAESDIQSGETGVALMQLDAGDRDGARQSVRQALALVPDLATSVRPQVTAAAVRALTKLGDIDAAQKELPGTGNVTLHLKASVFIAMAQVRAGQEKAALDLVAGPWMDDERVYILHQIGYAQAKAGNRDGASASFRKALEMVTTRSLRAHNLISAQAAAGDIAGAKEAALKIGDPWALQGVVRYQVQAGDVAGALEFARRGRVSEPMSLRMIAWHQGRVGQDAAARLWIAEEENRLLAVEALVQLAEGLYCE